MRSVVKRAAGAALVLLVSASGCTSTGETPEPTAPPTTGGETTTSPVVADLTLEATTLRTQGSTGAPPADIDVTVRNNGTTAPAITLTFSDVPTGIAPIGDRWASCDQRESGSLRTIVCELDPVPPGGSATYRYEFQVAFEEVRAQVESTRDVGRVSVAARDAQEADTTDDAVKLEICTNACTYPPGTYD